MAEYTFEVAEWCPTVAKITPHATYAASTDIDAINSVMLGNADSNTWGRLSETSANGAWPDGKTVAAWNIAHPVHGNYQARLRR